MSDAEVARISKECKTADCTLFEDAYTVSPRPVASKSKRYVMAERLLKCWNKGDTEEGVEGLKTWMTSNPTKQVQEESSALAHSELIPRLPLSCNLLPLSTREPP